MIEIGNIVVYADGRDTCFLDTAEDTVDGCLMSDGVCKEYRAVEILEVRQVEYIELTFFVIGIDRTSERDENGDIQGKLCG